jgi:hypothetical protein
MSFTLILAEGKNFFIKILSPNEVIGMKWCLFKNIRFVAFE